MMLYALLAALVPVAYLAGSVPFGLIIALRHGVDPRKSGSGNIGATNVGRLLGGRFFAQVFILDLLKGFAPTFAGTLVYQSNSPQVGSDLSANILWLAIGLAAILGHMFSLFLGFKGGKGVATSAGVILGIFPFFTLPGLVAAGVWGIVFGRWRYVSLASILGSGAFPIAYVLLGLIFNWPIFGKEHLPFLLLACAVAVLIIYKHKSNIIRLRRGEEIRSGR